MRAAIDTDDGRVRRRPEVPGQLIDVVQASFGIRSHRDLLSWLQGGFQSVLPHEALFVVWGDPLLQSFEIDITSSLSGERTRALVDTNLRPVVRALLDRWIEARHRPCKVEFRDGRFCTARDTVDHPLFVSGRSALIHGIRNQRDRQLSLYVLLHSGEFPRHAQRDFEVLLPCVDAALRQIEHLPRQAAARPGSPTPDGLPLSSRETDIVRWVAAGKTNEEIGLIMSISQFTVKNHLGRIFRKLDVSNRAQVVERVFRHERADRQNA